MYTVYRSARCSEGFHWRIFSCEGVKSCEGVETKWKKGWYTDTDIQNGSYIYSGWNSQGGLSTPPKNVLALQVFSVTSEFRITCQYSTSTPFWSIQPETRDIKHQKNTNAKSQWKHKPKIFWNSPLGFDKQTPVSTPQHDWNHTRSCLPVQSSEKLTKEV